MTKAKPQDRPFLHSAVLASTEAIELGGAYLHSAEVLEAHRRLGGNLVVSNGLRKDLFEMYTAIQDATKQPPKSLVHSSYPEYHFIPQVWATYRESPSGAKVPGHQYMVLFFAVRKGF